MQEDRRARKNTFQRGVKQEDHNQSVGLTQGVPMFSYWGQAKDQGMPATAGIPHIGQGKITLAPPKCKGKNKEGNPCGARPMKSGDYCVGHQRAVDAAIRNSRPS